MGLLLSYQQMSKNMFESKLNFYTVYEWADRTDFYYLLKKIHHRHSVVKFVGRIRYYTTPRFGKHVFDYNKTVYAIAMFNNLQFNILYMQHKNYFQSHVDGDQSN